MHIRTHLFLYPPPITTTEKSQVQTHQHYCNNYPGKIANSPFLGLVQTYLWSWGYALAHHIVYVYWFKISPVNYSIYYNRRIVYYKIILFLYQPFAEQFHEATICIIEQFIHLLLKNLFIKRIIQLRLQDFLTAILILSQIYAFLIEIEKIDPPKLRILFEDKILS